MYHFWQNKKVVVTGGGGFVGSHLVDELLAQGAKITVPTRNPDHLIFLEKIKPQIQIVSGNLENQEFCKEITKGAEFVFHLAASVGGIHFNMVHHGSIFKENMQMAINIMEASKTNAVARILLVSSACVYSAKTNIPTREEEGYKDFPEITNEGYGWAKRAAEFMAKFYKNEYKMNIAIARPCNVYGPRDSFDPARSHVIAGLIHRAFKDRPDPFVVWGSGEQTRSFIYVEDLVQGLLLMTEKGPNADPINFCSDEEIKIKDLVQQILRCSNYCPKISFDRSRPDGYPRRLYDHLKAEKILGFKTHTSLNEGLSKTVAWYRKNIHP